MKTVWALVLVPPGGLCDTLRARGSSHHAHRPSTDVSRREGNQNEPQTQGRVPRLVVLTVPSCVFSPK